MHFQSVHTGAKGDATHYSQAVILSYMPTRRADKVDVLYVQVIRQRSYTDMNHPTLLGLHGILHTSHTILLRR